MNNNIQFVPNMAGENPSDCKAQGEEPPSKRPSLVKDLSYLQAERPKKRQSDSGATTADERPKEAFYVKKKKIDRGK